MAEANERRIEILIGGMSDEDHFTQFVPEAIKLECEGDYETNVSSSYQGKELMKMIGDTEPDIAILWLYNIAPPPPTDCTAEERLLCALKIISRIKRRFKKSLVIALSSFKPEFSLELAKLVGADFCFVMPEGYTDMRRVINRRVNLLSRSSRGSRDSQRSRKVIPFRKLI